MKKRFITVLVAICVATMLMVPFAAVAKPGHHPHGKPGCPPAPIVELAAGEEWVVEETTRLSKLTIAEGAIVTAPEGYSLTMTVNHVETPIEPGTYCGKVVLTPTEEIIVAGGGGPGGGGEFKFRTAIYVDDGAVVPEKSVLAAVVDGKVTDTSAKGVKIASVGPNFNGIMVTGDSTYTIDKSKINFVGNGGNDFAGYGAAISTTGYADVVVNKARIITDGVIRGGVFVGDDSIVEVNDSYIHTGSPPLPEVITGMMSVPWPLGLTGTCRSTIVVGRGTAYYNNSHIVAEGWGALSTDACQDVKLYATNCLIETVVSGYGAYADGVSLDTFSGCEFDVHDMALILTQGDAIFTDGCVVNSGRFGVMQHSGRGLPEDPENLIIEKGCVFNTQEAVMMIKSSAPNIFVDDAKLNSKSGVILHVMVSDDPGSGANSGDVYASFGNMTMKGDIINSMTGVWVTKTPMGGGAPYDVFVGGDLFVNFSNVSITGAVTTATHTNYFDLNGIDVSGLSPFDPANYHLSPFIGLGETVYGPPDNDKDGVTDPYGIIATLDNNTTWVVDETSYLTGLTIAEGAIVTAPKCYSVTMWVDGVETAIGPGTYEGEIVLEVSESDYCPDHGHHHGHHHHGH